MRMLTGKIAQGTALTKIYNSGQVPYSNYFKLTFSNNGR